MITRKWIFKNKVHADGSLKHRKACSMVRGFKQRLGIDFDQTFSPVIKPTTIRPVLHLATSHHWPVHQLDVKNAFLHAELQERVCCFQPAGFIDGEHPDYVCLLSKSLYGLKQAPQAWFQTFSTELQSIGFRPTSFDSSLFVYGNSNDITYLLLYVDDIVLTASSTPLLQSIIQHLGRRFAMKDLGLLHYFLGINVQRTSAGFLLTQSKYAEEILERAGMMNCKPAATPVDTKPKVSCADGNVVHDASFYQSIVGALQYLTMTRPDIANVMHQVCLHMHAPCDAHWTLVKRTLWYIRGTLSHGLQIYSLPSTELTVYSDADWTTPTPTGLPRHSTINFGLLHVPW